jgi:hypothetical protein
MGQLRGLLAPHVTAEFRDGFFQREPDGARAEDIVPELTSNMWSQQTFDLLLERRVERNRRVACCWWVRGHDKSAERHMPIWLLQGVG